jgi:hypothetical protein
LNTRREEKMTTARSNHTVFADNSISSERLKKRK